ncbi:ParA family protein [Nitrosomonas sp. JL21]|uniref:ParA family protein n=1 Tax=Nitrosomonas sp. JL21 TaxID=153949 RepID=UPI00136E9423|nr:ParA family protein [Nitrosomonas sp. JL21]MXS77961.1 ParA family protein [Nitrosomonas sp. JL21]
MPTIVFASSKGGAGKTTAAIVLASELSQHNTTITLIDADPNQHSAKWAQKDGCPTNIKLIEKSTEETIIEDIDTAQEKTAFVLVDLEGTASMAVASAISRADLVITLCQGSQDDADEAAKTIKLVNRQAKVLNRAIPYAVLMTRTNPAITPRTLKHIMNEFHAAGVEIFKTSLIDREAFRAIRSFGGTIHDLDPAQVSGVEKAVSNAHALAVEVIEKIKSLKKERELNHG